MLESAAQDGTSSHFITFASLRPSLRMITGTYWLGAML